MDEHLLSSTASRRRWLLLAAAAASGCAGKMPRESLELITADVRPLSIAGGPRRGIVLDILAEAAARTNHDLRLRFLPFAEAAAATASQPGSLMTPLARTPQREASYGWIAKIIDVPQAMGTRVGEPVADLAASRSLKAVGVVRAGVQEGFLRENGFTNLAPMATARELATALAEGKIDAWYATATEIVLQFESIGRQGGAQVGPTVQVVPVWLAGHREYPNARAGVLAKALKEMEQDGATQRHYKSYVGS
jgi:polar amino acid transport system substrate-binding protein